MMNLAQFKSAAGPLEYLVKEARDGKLYITVPKAGKLELDVKKGRWVVGSGAKDPRSVAEAVVKAGFELERHANSWSFFKFRSESDLQAIAMAMCTVVPTSEPKATLKVKPAKDGIPKHGIVTKSEVKAKNLAAIKQVAARRTADPTYYASKVKDIVPTQVPSDDEDLTQYVPRMFHREVGLGD
jgi:hypothetical protein